MGEGAKLEYLPPVASPWVVEQGRRGRGLKEYYPSPQARGYSRAFQTYISEEASDLHTEKFSSTEGLRQEETKAGAVCVFEGKENFRAL